MDSNQQPQPPVQAPQQPMPQPAQQAPTGYPTPPKSSNKGLVIGLGIGGGVLFLILVTLLILFLTVWSGPSRADYKKAHDAMQEVSTNYNSARSTIISISSGMAYGTVSDSTIDRFNDNFTKYKASVAELKDLKALKDEDVKKTYDAYIAQNEKFTSYVDGLIGSVKAMSAAAEECGSLSSASSALGDDLNTMLSKYDELVKECNASVTKLETSKNTAIVQFAKDYNTSMTEMRTALAGMIDAAKAQDMSKVSAAQSKLTTAAGKLSTIGTDFSSKMSDQGDEAEVKDELNALGELITDKANGK